MRVFHRLTQRLLGFILNRLIDREYDSLSGLGSDLVALVGLAGGVFLQKQLSGLTRDLFVVRTFEAAEPVAIEADVTKDVKDRSK